MSNPEIYKKPLAVGQVAKICCVSKKTVLNWIYNGALKAFTTHGGHYRVWPVNIKKFLDSSGMDIPFEYVDDTSQRILIIDDERPFIQMMKSVISAELPDVDVSATEDGYEGLLLIGELKPQLLVLDIKMPKVDGFQVLELLRSRKIEHDMRILVISGYLDDETLGKLPRDVVDVVLEKSTEIKVLIDTIAGLVRGEVSSVQS